MSVRPTGALTLLVATALLLGGGWLAANSWGASESPLPAPKESPPAPRPSQPQVLAQSDILIPRRDTESATPPTAPSAANKPPQPTASPPAASSQSGTTPAPSQPATQATGEPAKPAVDETALRYFARQGDTRRLNTEIARLRSLYPDWVPPDDPLKAPPIADPQLDALWQLYSQGQFAAARAAIAARQSKEPAWLPPKDLLDRLTVAETRERLVNASNAKQYMTVIELATSTPSLLTCGDVDVLWRVAEAFAQTDRRPRAQDAYRYILSTCTDPRDRLSTVQKAMTLLPRAELEPLLALAHTGADGDEFRSVRESLARTAVLAGGSNANSNASPVDLKILEDAASSNTVASDALALGGYYRLHGDPTKAEHWSRLAYQRENAAPEAEMLALSLIDLQRPAEAEVILAPWHDTNEGTRKSYMAAIANLLALQPPPLLPSDVLVRITAAVARQRDAAAAQQLGWYSHYYRQDDTAARWFALALSWKPDDEPSAYGLAIANLSLNRRDAARAVANAWASRSLRIRALIDPEAARQLALAGGPAQQNSVRLTSAPVAVAPTEGAMAQSPPAPPGPPPVYLPGRQGPAAPYPPASSLGAPVQAYQPATPSPVPADYPAPSAPQNVAPLYQAAPAQDRAPTTYQAALAPLQYAQPALQGPVPPQAMEAPSRSVPARSAPRRNAQGSRGAAGSSATAPVARNGSCGGGLNGAWCLMNLNRTAEAVIVFKDVLGRGSERERQDAAYGLSLAYLRLGLTTDAATAATQAPQPAGRARDLNLSILTQNILSSYRAGRYSQTLISLDERAALSPEQTDLLMVRGWSYFHLQRFREARQVFEAVAASGNSEALGAIEAVKEATHSRY